MYRQVVAASVAVFTLSGALHASTLMPEAVRPSNLVVQLEEVAPVASRSFENDFNSPVAIGENLYVVNQNGSISIETSSGYSEVLSTANLPTGLTPTTAAPILNMAGSGNTVFVSFRSTTLPDGLDANALPVDPFYNAGAYDIVYRYDRAADGSLSSPTPLAAFESVVRGHYGGGMLVLPDGSLAYARGDQLGFNVDGRAAPQDDTSTVGHLLLIDPDNGSVEVAASGIRNVQRLTFADEAQTRIAFADIGGVTAEEINVISVADLTDTSAVENYGWGRNADGNAREGTFYINEGAGAVPGTVAEAIGEAPSPEAGFVQPYAQFNREPGAGFFAVTGPVWSDVSFSEIDLLFGDLVTGELFATIDSTSDSLNDVFSVTLLDMLGNETSLLDVGNIGRVDLRFFNFADGGAGLLLELTGQVFRISEVTLTPVPLPASGLLLLGSLLGLSRYRRRPN